MRPGHAGLARVAAGIGALVLAGGTVAPGAGPLDVGATPGACRALAAPAEQASPRADCCFINRAFTGVCRVKPADGETCATILAYLNDPRSQGRSYCGGTTIRSGWQQVSCEAPPGSGPVETIGR